jgi:hypothetical protein
VNVSVVPTPQPLVSSSNESLNRRSPKSVDGGVGSVEGASVGSRVFSPVGSIVGSSVGSAVGVTAAAGVAVGTAVAVAGAGVVIPRLGGADGPLVAGGETDTQPTTNTDPTKTTANDRSTDPLPDWSRFKSRGMLANFRVNTLVESIA